MKIILCAVNDELCDAWKWAFAGLPEVSVYGGSIFDVVADALVSPANSFGFMDGGLDLILRDQLGMHVETALRSVIANDYFGELLVGQAVLVETGYEHYRYLFAAPTMRMPSALPPDTVNPYLATRAVLLLWKYGVAAGPAGDEPVSSLIQTVAFPGMGTGIGGVPPRLCARQMREAFDDVLYRPCGLPQSWDEATDRHHVLTGSAGRPLVRQVPSQAAAQ